MMSEPLTKRNRTASAGARKSFNRRVQELMYLMEPHNLVAEAASVQHDVAAEVVTLEEGEEELDRIEEQFFALSGRVPTADSQVKPNARASSLPGRKAFDRRANQLVSTLQPHSLSQAQEAARVQNDVAREVLTLEQGHRELDKVEEYYKSGKWQRRVNRVLSQETSSALRLLGRSDLEETATCYVPVFVNHEVLGMLQVCSVFVGEADASSVAQAASAELFRHMQLTEAPRGKPEQDSDGRLTMPMELAQQCSAVLDTDVCKLLRVLAELKKDFMQLGPKSGLVEFKEFLEETAAREGREKRSPQSHPIQFIAAVGPAGALARRLHELRPCVNERAISFLKTRRIGNLCRLVRLLCKADTRNALFAAGINFLGDLYFQIQDVI